MAGMALQIHELALIRQSFDVLGNDPESKSIYFYDTLFQMDPELRHLFRDDIAGQGMRFMSTLREIVEHLHDQTPMEGRYHDLGEGHAAIGVTAANFRMMGKALVETLRHFLGEEFTPETEAAWKKAYDQISRTIMREGDIAQGS